MYVPEQLEETRLDVLHELVQKHPLGTWVSAEKDGLNVNHIPFLLEEARGNFGTLVGHVARANPVWRNRAAAVADVVVFRGPQAYITPS